jgi:hypothetical protein
MRDTNTDTDTGDETPPPAQGSGKAVTLFDIDI